MDNILKTVGIFNEMFMKEVEKIINSDNEKEILGKKIHNAIKEDVRVEKIIQELKEKKTVLNNSNISFQIQIKKLEKHNYELLNENSKTKIRNANLGIENHTLKQQKEVLIQEVEKLENENTCLLNDLTRYKESDQELRKQNIELKEINNNLHKKLNDLISQNNEANTIKERATKILYKKSSEIFGNKHIFEQTIEEMAELMVEINKVRRVNEGFDLSKINNLPQVMEEVCDVQMCLNHLKILFNEVDFKNVQVKKFDKFTDHFKRQFNKKENQKKLNDLTSNPETRNHVFFPLDINEDQLFAESVNGCP